VTLSAPARLLSGEEGHETLDLLDRLHGAFAEGVVADDQGTVVVLKSGGQKIRWPKALTCSVSTIIGPSYTGRSLVHSRKVMSSFQSLI